MTFCVNANSLAPPEMEMSSLEPSARLLSSDKKRLKLSKARLLKPQQVLNEGAINPNFELIVSSPNKNRLERWSLMRLCR